MISREYLATQAATLLKLAKITSNPEAAAALRDQAARLQARSIADDTAHDDLPPYPSAGKRRKHFRRCEPLDCAAEG
jgi:hypothetical protein